MYLLCNPVYSLVAKNHKFHHCIWAENYFLSSLLSVLVQHASWAVFTGLIMEVIDTSALNWNHITCMHRRAPIIHVGLVLDFCIILIWVLNNASASYFLPQFFSGWTWFSQKKEVFNNWSPLALCRRGTPFLIMTFSLIGEELCEWKWCLWVELPE